MANNVKCSVMALPQEDVMSNNDVHAGLEELAMFLRKDETDEDGRTKTNHFSLDRIVPEDMNEPGHDWYHWRLDNWGCKWDTYESERIGDCLWEFITPWSAPIPAIQRLSTLFPRYEFILEYADEDLGYNCGIIRFKDGVREGEPFKGGTKEASLFAADIWGFLGYWDDEQECLVDYDD